MSYLEELHAAHKARRARLQPEPPKQMKSFEMIISEKDTIIRKQQETIDILMGENRTLKVSNESLRASVRSKEPDKPPQATAPFPVTVANIVTATCRHFGISYADMIGQRRTLEVIMPRQIAMYLAKKLTQRSLPEIGRRMGGRDHTTVLHACRKIQAMIDDGAMITADIDIISAMMVEQPTTLAHDKSPSEHAGAST